MCGIVGTIGYNTDEYVKVMNRCQLHRGPDEGDTYFDVYNQVCIGMRRLSIVDLQSGHQPMTNEDGTVYVVFNGEIFYAPVLRKELVASGHQFYTKNSDTEVLVHLYEQYGVRMLSKLNGMFAFIILDQKEKKVFAARDYAGMKPLYYAIQGDKLIFSSELKCILETGLIEETLNMNSVYHYLSLQFIPAPDTIFNEINKLPAAGYLLFDLETKGVTTRKYWHPNFSTEFSEKTDWQDYILENFQSAVDRWSISDVPIAASLSAGIDSTAIVAMLRKVSMDPIDTYTLGFLDAPECDEHVLAGKAAKYFGTNHHEIMLTVDELLQDLGEMIYSLDEPYAGGLPSWYIYKEMSKDFKVGFSGLGGDELFGNYGKWIRYEDKTAHLIRIGWEFLNRENFCTLRKYPRGGIYHKYMTEGMKQRIVDSEHVKALDKQSNTAAMYEKMILSSREKHWRNIVPWIDFQMQLPDEFLHMTDRFSMYFSLEARTPFLDKELIEAVYAIPQEIRTNKTKLKYLFIDSVKDLIPQEIIDAPKKGFVLPYRRWMNGRLKEVVQSYTSPGFLKEQGIFSEDLNKVLIRPFYQGKQYYTSLVWTILMFQLWYVGYQEKRKCRRRVKV